MHNFRKLDVWKKSKDLVKEIYALLNEFPNSEKYVLIQQMQRAAISIPSNIAEGAGRNTEKDFIRFLNIAFSSSYELETQLIIAFDLNYFKSENLDEILEHIHEIQKMIQGLIKTLNEKKSKV